MIALTAEAAAFQPAYHPALPAKVLRLTFEPLLAIAPPAITATLALLLALYAGRRLPDVDARAFVFLIGGVILWAISYGLLGRVWLVAPPGPLELFGLALLPGMLVALFLIWRYRPLRGPEPTREWVVDQVPDGILALDEAHQVTEVNRAASDILNRPVRQLLGRPVTDLFPDARRLELAVANPAPARLEVTLNGRDPARSYQLFLSAPSEASGDGGRVLVVQDITERKQQERMRHELIQTMVHDLRNPIASHMTMLELLAEHLDDLPEVERAEMIEAARRSMHRTLRMVEQILEISGLESGQLPLAPGPVNLASLVQELIQSQLALAAEQKLTLENQVSDQLPPAWADADLVARVLQNVIGNAVKFTGPGGQVRVTATIGDDHRIVIRVTDTGPGIDSALRQRLFQKFAAGRGQSRGSGLGLAFCQMVLAAHGEQIWVEESSSQGTTMAFTLPVADLDERRVRPESQAPWLLNASPG